MICGTVDLILSTAIHDNVDIGVRDLSQFIGLLEETFGSLPSLLSNNVSLSSDFYHDEDREMLRPSLFGVTMAIYTFGK